MEIPERCLQIKKGSTSPHTILGNLNQHSEFLIPQPLTRITALHCQTNNIWRTAHNYFDYAPSARVLLDVLMYRTASKEFKYDHHQAILIDRLKFRMEIHFKLVPLFPRMKASPYLFFSWPFTYSSVCSIAMFMYPSRQAKIPAQRKTLMR